MEGLRQDYLLLKARAVLVGVGWCLGAGVGGGAWAKTK